MTGREPRKDQPATSTSSSSEGTSSTSSGTSSSPDTSGGSSHQEQPLPNPPRGTTDSTPPASTSTAAQPNPTAPRTQRDPEQRRRVAAQSSGAAEAREDRTNAATRYGQRNLFAHEWREIETHLGQPQHQSTMLTDEETIYRDPPSVVSRENAKRPREDSNDDLAEAPTPQRQDLRDSPRAAPPTPTTAPNPHMEIDDAGAGGNGPPTRTTSYCAVAASPPKPAESQVPGTATAQTEPSTSPPGSGRGKIPPITVDNLPNWTQHFKNITARLGAPPNARPMGKGMRFLPKTVEEYRTVQAYLIEANSADPTIVGHALTLPEERPHKVAILGLPRGTPTEAIKEDLERKTNLSPSYIREIPPRRGRPGAVYHVVFPHLTQDQLKTVYGTRELLLMANISIKEWEPPKSPPQCHRCQGFGHSSQKCFRAPRCVRCAGEHVGSDCDRKAPVKCANCGKSHSSNDKRCPILQREARKRGIQLPPPAPNKPARAVTETERAALVPNSTARGATTTRPEAQPPAPPPPYRAPPTPAPVQHTEPTQASNLMAPANPASERGIGLTGGKRRRKPRKHPLPPATTIVTVPEETTCRQMPPPEKTSTTTTATSTKQIDTCAQAQPHPTATTEQPTRRSYAAATDERKTKSVPDNNRTGAAYRPPPRSDDCNTQPKCDSDSLSIAIDILLEILRALKEGADPTTAISNGIVKLLQAQQHQYHGTTRAKGDILELGRHPG